MRQLLDIVLLFKEYLVLIACILISVALLATNDTPQIRAIRSVAVVSVGFVQDVLGFIPDYFSLKKENTILRERNVTLADEVSLLRESKLENFRLRQMLALKQRAAFTYVAANVIGKNVQPMRATITLDAGETDGVKYNMPIVTDAGLVGRVIATSKHYAIGQLLLHKDFRVSARVQRARADGILYWNGERCEMKNVPRTHDVKQGDAIITSSYSTIYPEGIKIGVIASAHVEPGALFHTIAVEPTVDFSTLEEVFVITQVPDSARVALEQTRTK
ncbi:MAG: rod shape-determining protein MreC [Ignavibacteriae bacterium]|nr:rod shape-determining protein MreC [Ignavibacteriota bacterium]